MITSASSTEQILKELYEEHDKAIYWLKKKYHGDRGFEKMRQGLLDYALLMKTNAISEVHDYISPKGNRWMMFENCRYYKDINYANTSTVAFCYYETIGSVGAFTVGNWQYGGGKTCVLFTNHFFLRFCDRLHLKMRSRWMVQRFIEVIPGFLFNSTGEKDQYGRVKVDVRIPGGIGRGIFRKDGDLIEIRTFLDDPELTKKQLRETKKLRETAEHFDFAPTNVRMERMAQSDDMWKALKKEMKQAIAMGADEKLVTYSTQIGIYIIQAIVDMGYAKTSDKEFWERHGKVNVDLLYDITKFWIDRKPVDHEFVGYFEKMLKNDGIKEPDVEKFINRLFYLIEKDNKDNQK